MKKTVLFMLVFLVFAFAKTLIAQSNHSMKEVSGIYKDKYSLEGTTVKNDGNKHWWKLTLDPTGRFEYHYFRQLKLQGEEHFYGRGNWQVDGRTIIFSTKEGDVDEKYFVNFKGTKAIFSAPSPRSKNRNIKKQYLHFFESEEVALGNLKLFKSNE